MGGAAVAFFGAAQHEPLVTVIGLALGEIGLVIATGAMVGLAARFAGRMPLPAGSRSATRPGSAAGRRRPWPR